MVLRIFERKDHKTRYAMVPHSFKNWTVPMMLPKRVVDKAIAKELGLVNVNDS